MDMCSSNLVVHFILWTFNQNLVMIGKKKKKKLFCSYKMYHLHSSVQQLDTQIFIGFFLIYYDERSIPMILEKLDSNFLLVYVS